MPTDYAALANSLRTTGGARPTRPGGGYLARTSVPKKRKNRSLFGQFTGMLTGLPAGLAKLSAQAAGDVLYRAPRAVLRPVTDIATGHPDRAVKSLKDLADFGTLGLLSEGSGGFERNTRVLPMLGTSFHTTGTNLRHPTRYYRAAKDGEILPMLVEDIGNLAIVGGAAAKGLTAGSKMAGAAGNVGRAESLARAASVTNRVSKLGGRVGDAPVSVYRGGARFIRNNALDPLMAKTEMGIKMADRHPMLFKKAARETKGRMLDEQISGAMADRRQVGSMLRAQVTKPGERALRKTSRRAPVVMTKAEEAAAHMLHTDEAGVIGQSQRLLADAGLDVSPDVISAVRTRLLLEGHHAPPDAATIAVAIRNEGAVNPNVTGAADTIKAGVGQYETMIQGGHGGTPVSRENLLAAPVPTDRAFIQWARDNYDPRLPDDATPAQAIKAVTDVEGFGGYQTIADYNTTKQPLNPADYPAPWRRHMDRQASLQGTVNEAANVAAAMTGTPVNQALIDAVPRTPFQMAQNVGGLPGVKPRYLPGGEYKPPNNARLRGRKMLADPTTTPGAYKASHEYFDTAAAPLTYGMGNTAGLLHSRIVRLTENAKFNSALEAGRTTTDVFEPADLADMQASARAYSAGLRGQGASKSDAVTDFKRYYDQEYGKSLMAAADQKGLEAFPAEGNIGGNIPEYEINDNTIWVPKGMRDALAPWVTPTQEMAGVMGAIEKANGIWKGWILPGSIRWQIGDPTSNMLMSWVAGGVNPLEQIRYARLAREMLDTPEGARLLDSVEPHSGLTMAESQTINGLDAVPPKTPLKGFKTLTKMRDASFKLNEITNGIGRQSLFLAKLDEALQREGLGPLDPRTRAQRKAGAPLDNPQIGQLSETLNVPKIGHDSHLWPQLKEAVLETDKIMADMVNLPPKHRTVLKTIFPFWPWMRHVALLSGRLALDDPYRALLIMRLGDLVGTEDELPPWMQGSVKGPGGWWSTNFVNPLGDVGGLPGMPFGKGTFARSLTNPMSPAIKVGAAALLGQDFDKGGLPLTRTPGTGWFDESGNAVPLPLLFRPQQLAYRAAKQFPITRVALNTLPGGAPLGISTGGGIRYASGEPIIGKGKKPIQSGDSLLTKLGPLVGLPLPVPDNKIVEWRAKQRKNKRKRMLASR